MNFIHPQFFYAVPLLLAVVIILSLAAAARRRKKLAALLGSSREGKGRLILRKFAQDGVTVALAMKKWSVNFE